MRSMKVEIENVGAIKRPPEFKDTHCELILEGIITHCKSERLI